MLGGKIPTLKAIQAHAKAMNYGGYAAEDIAKAANKAEPQRTAALNAYKDKFKADLKRDISRYRECVRILNAWRKAGVDQENPTSCADIHVSVGLKFSHMINVFAHLHLLEGLYTQRDLFDFS
ncbi:conserved hypothetical protein [Ahrensia sp. R2A130]|nr:conserved hypothetical protein [Ahrensia sp. R2A130]